MLRGYRILDISQFLSGARCSQILADLGAEVVKVEPPQGEVLRIMSSLMPGADRAFSVLHRNKKGITLNLKSKEGKDIFKKLIKVFDVLIENFTPGTMEKMGLGYNELKKINPEIVHLSISGFGSVGPLSKYPAFDIIAQAAGGIMDALRSPDKSPGVFFADLVSGAYAALGIVTCLLYKQRNSKKGSRFIDISMQDVMYFHNYRAMSRRALEDKVFEFRESLGLTPEVLASGKKIPFWNSYKTKDGYVVVVALTDEQFKSLCEAIGRDDFIKDQRFSNIIERFKNAEPLLEILEKWFEERTSDEAIKILREKDVPASIVQDVERLLFDEQLLYRNMLLKINHPRFGDVKIPGFPIKIENYEFEAKTPAPELGQNNYEVYRELGISEDEIKILRQKGVI